ncbi:G_PROTEIN_RECEP_F1_2 domain-containing protein [Meloidogyne graminicola]|uniref:G_PROTEIN_RECEP_F1_2 domain-containing protein n=1 Tax=Meloidogyne graminicola TaxID=189291 RepID=A0A8S9ZZK7_9BILA|nr:G_PROTEIN_RECEP_F1_2 domain-containing protein [Meloidogyne graminicola]
MNLSNNNIKELINNSNEIISLMNLPLIKNIFLIAYIFVFILCVFGNLIVLICIIGNKSMRTVTNFFLANLAIADLLVGIFCLFLNAIHFALFSHGTWPFGKILCHTYIYILHLIPNSSAGILILLSVERFIAVLRPMIVQNLMTKSVLIFCTLFVWTLSSLMNIPYLIAVQYINLNNSSKQNYGICTRHNIILWNINILKLISTINLIIWYILPLFILFTIYATIGFVLIRTTDNNKIIGRITTFKLKYNNLNKQKLNNKICKELNKYSKEIKQKNLTKIELVDSRKRVIRLCSIIVLAFALLSLPRYIYLTWSIWRETNAPRCLNCLSALIQPTTFLLMFFASAINPILYAFLSQRFRSAIKDTFSFGKRKAEQKEHMLKLLRNHRLSTTQLEKDVFGVPINNTRTISCTKYIEKESK